MYRAIVLSTLLYSVETLIVYKADAQRLYIYMMHQLYKILNVKWWQHIPNKLIKHMLGQQTAKRDLVLST